MTVAHRSLIVIAFIGITVLAGVTRFQMGRLSAAQEQQHMAVSALNTLTLQHDVAQHLIAMKPAIDGRLRALTHGIAPPRLTDEHASIDTCARSYGNALQSYTLESSALALTLAVDGPQNGLIRFVDCLDRAPLAVDTTKLDLQPKGKGLELTLTGAIVGYTP